MDAPECKEAYTKVFQNRMYQGRLDSLLTRDECAALQNAYLASLPRDACKRPHRYRSSATGLPAFVVCSCGGELWGRNDQHELNLATVMGHTLLHYGGEDACGACIKTGIILLFRAWLLSSSEDRELIALACTATCECVSRQYLLSPDQNAVARELHADCPGPCRRRSLAWCHGMESSLDSSFDMLNGVLGDLDGSLRDDMTSLCSSPGVHLPSDYESLDSYSKGLTTLYCFTSSAGPGQSTGLAAPINRWCMINELQSQFNEKVAKYTYDGTGTPFAPWAGPALNSVLSTRARKDRPVRQTKFASLEAYSRERLADGFWIAMQAGVNSPAADDFYLSRNAGPLPEYAIDSVCAFDTFSHPRALQEDALYGGCSYEREPPRRRQQATPNAYQDILYSAAYIALASYVWGANAHLDLMRGRAVLHSSTTSSLPDHWYARVWQDALFGRSEPGELYRNTVLTKDKGSFTGDEAFTGCQPECSCPERYHSYGLGATLSWVRETWCGLPCSATAFDVWMFGSFVDDVRVILRCGEGRHSARPERDLSKALPIRKACIGDLSQVRCQIVHLIVWCAIDRESAFPRASINV